MGKSILHLIAEEGGASFKDYKIGLAGGFATASAGRVLNYDYLPAILPIVDALIRGFNKSSVYEYAGIATGAILANLDRLVNN